MFLFKLSAFLCLVASSSFSVITTTEAQVDRSYPVFVCPNTTTFSPNSTYESNLKALLSRLSSNATYENGYYNTTTGVNNTVYGAFLCRGDLTADRCQQCVSAAAGDVIKSCPVQKKSVFWYAECMVRYSDESFFSVPTEDPVKILVNTAFISEPERTRFLELLIQTMNKSVTEAANGNGGKKYATREAYFSSSQNLYTLAQCTPDLSVQDCNGCLEMATAPGDLRAGRQGTRVLIPSCNVRYEIYKFYTGGSSPTPAESQPPPEGKSGTSAGVIVAIVVPIVLALLFMILACWFINRRRAKRKYNSVPEESVEISSVEFLQFDLDTIKVATNNFCDDNKLGEGGFGEVYKGSLANGQNIAVKRLSSSSRQGAEEFKNEVVLVARLQHRNLVRLLGFCLDGEEKVLIYEFVTNKSLDYFLFDPEKNRKLNWSRRYRIIEGIARGLLYLHEDSRLKIIHRDLKASNILLDEDFNAKISDFGMARIFGVDQTQVNTDRIVGTLGYMAPEYAMRGHVSIKLDVYSFGILVLELLTGKKNTSFEESGYAEDLLNYAWKKWTDGTPLDLLDVNIRDSYSRDEVIRCIHIGLLCVQEDPAQRPTMQTVILTLSSQSVSVAMPERPPSLLSKTQPSFPTKGLETDTSTTTSKSIPLSVDESSITGVYPR